MIADSLFGEGTMKISDRSSHIQTGMTLAQDPFSDLVIFIPIAWYAAFPCLMIGIFGA